VLPVGLIGTDRCLGKGARWPRRVPVEVIFGRPFRIPERGPDGARVPRQEAADGIMLAIAELLPGEMRGEYSDLESLTARVGGLRQEV
jgi:hypothetical protein